MTVETGLGVQDNPAYAPLVQELQRLIGDEPEPLRRAVVRWRDAVAQASFYGINMSYATQLPIKRKKFDTLIRAIDKAEYDLHNLAAFEQRYVGEEPAET